MPLCTFDPDTDKKSANITLSNSNLTAAQTNTASWETTRGTVGKDASGSHYFEIVVDANGGNVMIGIGRWRPYQTESTMKGASWNDALHYAYYSTNGLIYNNGGGGAYGNTYTTGDVIGVLLKNGKLYFSKNGTWQNSANLSAETGFAFSGLTGLFVPLLICYSQTTATLRCNAASFSYSIPTGAHAWNRDGDVSVTLKTPAGAAVASTSIKWALFPVSGPQSITSAPDCAGTTATDGSGVLALDLTGTTLDDAATGLLIGSTTDGVAANQSEAFCLPVVVNVDVGA